MEVKDGKESCRKNKALRDYIFEMKYYVKKTRQRKHYDTTAWRAKAGRGDVQLWESFVKDLSADNNGSVGFWGVKWGGGLVV